MDKLMQAVNELKGDLGNSFMFKLTDNLLYSSGSFKYIALPEKSHGDKLKFICTVEEFNNLVAELSAAEWIKERL